MANEYSVFLGINSNLAKRGAKEYDRQAAKVAAAADRMSKQVKHTTTQFRKARNAVARFDDVIATVHFSEFISVFKDAARNASEFGLAMAEVSTLIDDSFDPSQTLADEVRRLSGEFGQMPVEQSKALYQVISAGADNAASAVSTLTVANKLAVGGITSVSVAADGLTSVLNAYDLSATEALNVSDAFFVAMKAGKTTVDQLSNAIGNAAPIAAQTGVSYEELLSSVSALTTGGVSTSQAMTGVRAALTAVLRPTEQAAEAAGKLGLAFNSRNLREKGFLTFMQEVKTAARGNTDTITKLFGSIEAMNAVMALTSNSGMATFTDNMGKMSDRVGETDTAVDKIGQTFGHLSDRLKSNLTSLSGELGESLTNSLIPALRLVNDHFVAISRVAKVTASIVAVVFSTKVIALAKNYLAALLAVPAANIAASYAVARHLGLNVALAASYTAVSSAVLVLRTALGFLMGPGGLVLAGVAALSFFASASANAQAKTDALTGSLEDQVTAFRALSAAQKEERLIKYRGALEDLNDEIKVAENRVLSYKAALKEDQFSGLLGGPEIQKSLEDRTKEFDAATNALMVLREEHDKITSRLGLMSSVLDEGSLSIERQTNAFKSLNEQLQSTVLHDKHEALRDTNDALNAQTVVLAEVEQRYRQVAAALRESAAPTAEQEEQVRAMAIAYREAQMELTVLQSKYASEAQIIAALSAVYEKLKKARDDASGNTGGIAEWTKEQAAALRQVLDVLDPLAALQRRYNDDLAVLNEAHKLSAISASDLAIAQGQLAANFNKAKDALKGLNSEFENAKRDAMRREKALKELIRMTELAKVADNDAARAALEHEFAMEDLVARFKAAGLELKEIIPLLEELEEAHKKAEEAAGAHGDGYDDLKDKSKTTAEVMEEALRSATERIEGLFVDLWASAFEGFDDFAEQLKKTFIRMLAELAHAAITRPIFVEIRSQITGESPGGLKGTGDLLGDDTGPLKKLLKKEGLFGADKGKTLGDNIGGAFIGAVTGGIGGGLTNASDGVAAVGGAIGGAIGSIWGPLGSAIGGFLGGAVGGLLFGGKKEVTGQGFDLDIQGGQLSGDQFTTTHTSGGLFRSSRTSTERSDLDSSFVDNFQRTLDETFGHVTEIAELLGASGDAFERFNISTRRLDLKDLSESQAAAKIEEFLKEVIGGGIEFFVRETEGLSDRLRNTVLMFTDNVEDMVRAFELAASIDLAILTDPMQSAFDEFRNQQKTLWEAYEDQNDALAAMVSGYTAGTRRLGTIYQAGVSIYDLLAGASNRFFGDLARQADDAEQSLEAPSFVATDYYGVAQGVAAAVSGAGNETLDSLQAIADGLGELETPMPPSLQPIADAFAEVMIPEVPQAPEMPALPVPEYAQETVELPAIGTFPDVSLPSLPTFGAMEAPEVPVLPGLGTFDAIPRLPEVEVPAAPELPSLGEFPEVPLPVLGAFPERIAMPEIQVPDAPGLPELDDFPDVRLPEIDVPGLKAPELPSLGAFPTVMLPELGTFPEVAPPEVRAFDALEAPEVPTLPDLGTFDAIPRLPNIEVPTAPDLPDLGGFPEVRLPALGTFPERIEAPTLPSLEAPQLPSLGEFPGVSLPEIDVPVLTAPELPSLGVFPDVMLPELGAFEDVVLPVIRIPDIEVPKLPTLDEFPAQVMLPELQAPEVPALPSLGDFDTVPSLPTLGEFDSAPTLPTLGTFDERIELPIIETDGVLQTLESVYTGLTNSTADYAQTLEGAAPDVDTQTALQPLQNLADEYVSAVAAVPFEAPVESLLQMAGDLAAVSLVSKAPVHELTGLFAEVQSVRLGAIPPLLVDLAGFVSDFQDAGNAADFHAPVRGLVGMAADLRSVVLEDAPLVSDAEEFSAAISQTRIDGLGYLESLEGLGNAIDDITLPGAALQGMADDLSSVEIHSTAPERLRAIAEGLAATRLNAPIVEDLDTVTTGLTRFAGDLDGISASFGDAVASGGDAAGAWRQLADGVGSEIAGMAEHLAGQSERFSDRLSDGDPEESIALLGDRFIAGASQGSRDLSSAMGVIGGAVQGGAEELLSRLRNDASDVREAISSGFDLSSVESGIDEGTERFVRYFERRLGDGIDSIQFHGDGFDRTAAQFTEHVDEFSDTVAHNAAQSSEAIDRVRLLFTGTEVPTDNIERGVLRVLGSIGDADFGPAVSAVGYGIRDVVEGITGSRGFETAAIFVAGQISELLGGVEEAASGVSASNPAKGIREGIEEVNTAFDGVVVPEGFGVQLQHTIADGLRDAEAESDQFSLAPFLAQFDRGVSGTRELVDEFPSGLLAERILELSRRAEVSAGLLREDVLVDRISGIASAVEDASAEINPNLVERGLGRLGVAVEGSDVGVRLSAFASSISGAVAEYAELSPPDFSGQADDARRFSERVGASADRLDLTSPADRFSEFVDGIQTGADSLSGITRGYGGLVRQTNDLDLSPAEGRIARTEAYVRENEELLDKGVFDLRQFADTFTELRVDGYQRQTSDLANFSDSIGSLSRDIPYSEATDAASSFALSLGEVPAAFRAAEVAEQSEVLSDALDISLDAPIEAFNRFATDFTQASVDYDAPIEAAQAYADQYAGTTEQLSGSYRASILDFSSFSDEFSDKSSALYKAAEETLEQPLPGALETSVRRAVSAAERLASENGVTSVSVTALADSVGEVGNASRSLTGTVDDVSEGVRRVTDSFVGVSDPLARVADDLSDLDDSTLEIVRSLGDAESAAQSIVDQNSALTESFDIMAPALDSVQSAVVGVSDAAGDAAASMGRMELSSQAAREEYLRTILNLDTVSEAQSSLNSIYDGSLDSLEDLTNAVNSVRNAQQELALAFFNLSDGVAELFGGTAQTIRESLLSDEELYTLRGEQIEALVSQLNTAISPDEIARLTQQISRFTSDSYNLLDESQQPELQEGFLLFLNDVEQLTQDRIESGLSQLAQDAQELEETVSAQLIASAADVQANAAQNFSDAVDRFGDWFVSRQGQPDAAGTYNYDVQLP